MALGLEHHSGKAAGIRVRWGNLRFRFDIEPSATRLDEQEPPDPCCAEDPGTVLIDVAADLVTLFDKWYGAANRTTVGNYYQWSGPCGDAPRVPTQAALLLAASDLCDEPNLIHELFNAMRDAIAFLPDLEYLDSKLRRRPGPVTNVSDCEFIPCQPLAKFTVLFTPTRPCDHPSPCFFASVGGTSKTTRVEPGEKLCVLHYLELQTILDDILANGVVEFKATVRPTIPCGGATEGMVCQATNTKTYGASDPLDDCCTNGDPNDCFCCFGPAPTVTGYYEEAYFGVFNNADLACGFVPPSCYTLENGCFPSPLRDNTPDDEACWYVKETLTQIGSSTFDPRSCEISFQARHRVVQKLNDDELECEPEVVLRNEIETYRIWRVRPPAGPCRWQSNLPQAFGFLTFNPNQDIPAEDCAGSIQTYAEGCEIDGLGTRYHEWYYRSMSIVADTSSCDASCNGTGCPCPGPLISDVDTPTEVPVGIAQPYATKSRTELCEAGSFDLSAPLKFEIKYGGTCPDSGLANIVMLDSRLGTVSAAYSTKTIAAPTVDSPGCPGLASRSCRPVCIIGYGELS